jgi:hypothetical protein
MERHAAAPAVLSPELCLSLWERTQTLHPLDSALLTLALTQPEPSTQFADWPFGHRNRALLELYARSFAPALEGWAACPTCGESMEMSLPIDALLASDSETDALPPTMEMDGRTYRLPSSRDLAALAGEGWGEGEGALQLAERCRLAGAPTDAASLALVGEGMAQADPLAELQIALACPACDASWTEPLDVWSFLQAALAARGRALLAEVHALARAYSWPEQVILALSPARREAYLQLILAEAGQ